MKTAKNIVNYGNLQGLLINEPYFPNEKTALFSIKVKDNRINPQTQKPNTYMIQCTAFGKEADKLRGVKEGTLVYARYHLTKSKRTDKLGITTIFNNRIADEVVVGEHLTGKDLIRVPYINEGIFQGELLYVYANEDCGTAHIAVRTEVESLSGKKLTNVLDFTAYGPIIKTINKFYSSGDPISLRYKIEMTKKKGESLTDYVITAV